MASVNLKPVSQGDAGLAGFFTAGRRQNLLLSLVLVVATVALYYPVNWQPFANFDDADYTFDNLHVKAGLQWETIKWAFTTRDAANWHPVTWLSHALDCQLFGLNPAGPHDVNVLLHVLNALLLFWVLQKATGWVGRSWMVAALFALHPINVESVAWIAERKNLLSMAFFLLTLAAYRWYVRQPRDSRYLLVAVLFALGLMSKPQVITLPFVLLLWDYWPLQRFSLARGQAGDSKSSATFSSLVWEKVPLFGLCAASAYMTMFAQRTGGAMSSYPLSMRLENAIISYARYVGKAVWPTRLAAFYPYPTGSFRIWQVAGALLFLLAVTALVIKARDRRYLLVGWLWFLGTLVPMVGVVQVGTQAMADRYAYLPFIGLFIMVCWGIADWAAQKHFPAVALKAAGVAALLALAVLTHLQVGYWNDHITLWTHATEVTKNNWLAENNLGTALLKEGRVEDAIPHFRAAVAINPTDPNSNLNIGTYEQQHGNLAAAVERYKAAVTLARNPKVKARAYNNLGYAYLDLKNFSDAKQSFIGAVQANPEFVGAWISLGLTEQKMSDFPGAIQSYSRALAMNPSDFGYLLLARAFEQDGQSERALAARRKAEQLSNNIVEAQRTADRLLGQ